MISIVFFSFGLLFTAPLNNRGVFAEEIHLLGGVVQEEDSRDRSYSWAVKYLHDLNEHWAVSFSWLNEGHFEHHHRGRNRPLPILRHAVGQRRGLLCGFPRLGCDCQPVRHLAFG